MWCVRWRSSRMRAPAFWYYQDEAQARETANALRRPGSEVSVSEMVNGSYIDRDYSVTDPSYTFEER